MSKITTEEPEGTAWEYILTELTRLRTEVGQLKAQIKIKDMQIAEIRKQRERRVRQ